MENEEDKELDMESEEVSSSHYWSTDLEPGSSLEEEVKESEEEEILASSSEESSGICKISIKGEQKSLNCNNESENETKMVIGNAEDDAEVDESHSQKQRDVEVKAAEISLTKPDTTASNNANNMIKAIDKKVVHQICSGQVSIAQFIFYFSSNSQ